MERNSLLGALAVASLVTSGVYASQAAQAPSPSADRKTPPAPSAVSQSGQAEVTLTGCVYQERDVPGRAPNAAERVGILEDYILADVKMDSPASATPGAAATAGANTMYKLELISDDKLQAVVGKRVEVTGRIDREAGDQAPTAATPQASTTDKVIGRDRVDLPEFEVSALKEVAGTCAAKPMMK